MTPCAAWLPDGRLHLQHGPIDCLCRAWGPDAGRAYVQAQTVFATILPTLCAELPALRAPLPGPGLHGPVARAMQAACAPFAAGFITPMAAVAGAVADQVLAAMTDGTALDRAFVNNGGDIAFHLAPGQTLGCGVVADLAAPALDATVALYAHDPARGIATSGRACKGQGGRSFSFGIADAVTVLAASAAQADAADSVIANAVDLPGHPAVTRRPASLIDPDSDLGERLITWQLGALSPQEVTAALDFGATAADAALHRGLIHGALLSLRGQVRAIGPILSLSRPA